MERRQESTRNQPAANQVKSRRLRRPKMVKVKAAAPAYIAPRVVPRTAQERRRRNTLQPVRAAGQAALDVLGSARWVSFLILLLCIYSLYLIGVNPRFHLHQIIVEGAGSLSADDIIQASGLSGVHIFAANPKAAADAVSTLSGVRSAAVELHWPQEVRIIVTEDAPVFVWEEAGQRYWVNDRGEYVPTGDQGVSGLMVITAEVPPAPTATPEPEAAAKGSEVETEAAQAFRPKTFLRFVPREVLIGAQQLVEIRPNIDRLFYTPYGGLSYQDGRGWRGYFGVGDDMFTKVALYETIIADLLARDITPSYINVSNPERPYYRAP